ncbi:MULTISPECIES: hypothetical protein [Streptomyces]|uniref:Uncharacterized protein n=1 Tax=Streptomyces venezuelae (strain ATCC 10712 / CBS 650.69 / DSM 40230 / JCM 4526 / NBRC 13096 / PD 04745) TaxID=953739 RepID=F2RFX6_STRVP|nr:hypothetical protein [Streptomyces venezuelae]APE23010.1 hypothetical protein vnz_19720 [Streptomyces venezuelae]QES00391.1 hypothetical protein DEJ43_19995 [Streptomyces venezuelae ATCC 10712]CCA57278.1 hypothetical protein SVEN_3992 [Streptomyces venezuelae ATCC 10712]
MSWKGHTRLFEDVSYDKLYDLEFGPDGYDDGGDDYIRALLPVLVDWKRRLEETRDRLRSGEDFPYREFAQRQIREESAAYQRALLKLSEAWLTYFFCCDGSGVPTSLIFEVDGGAK